MEGHEYTIQEIRKVALDMLGIGKLFDREMPNDRTMKDLSFRLRAVAVLLLSYFPIESPQHQLDLFPASMHTSIESSTGFVECTKESLSKDNAK